MYSWEVSPPRNGFSSWYHLRIIFPQRKKIGFHRSPSTKNRGDIPLHRVSGIGSADFSGGSSIWYIVLLLVFRHDFARLYGNPLVWKEMEKPAWKCWYHQLKTRKFLPRLISSFSFRCLRRWTLS